MNPPAASAVGDTGHLVWVPLSPWFRRKIRDAVEDAFLGHDQITTPLQEPVLKQDVLVYCQKAEGPLAVTFQLLRSVDRKDLVCHIEQLYPKLIAGFIQCGKQQPLHHTAYVLQFMATILIGEGRSASKDMAVGMLAALFHDSAQGESTVPKITEDHMREKVREVVRDNLPGKELLNYLKAAVKGRREHMEQGAELARKMLGSLMPGEMGNVIELIRRHDEPKIPVADKVVREELLCKGKDDEVWKGTCETWCRAKGIKPREQLLDDNLANCLISQNDEDWLLQLLHEADLLWMVTQDGVDVDLARKPPTKRKTPIEMLEHNAKLHRDEVDLYRIYRENEFDDGKFQICELDDGTSEMTIYRSDTGSLLYRHLCQATRLAYTAPRQ